MMTKKKKKHWWVKLIWLLVVLAIIAAICWFGVLPMLRATYTVTYDEYTATTGSISNALSFSGSFALENDETLYPSANTTVRTIYVSEGDTVSAGDKLMKLADGEVIKAGFDGTVNDLMVEKEDEVTAGTALVQVADFTHQEVSIRVDEYDISEVSVGQACTVTATALEKTYETTISSINYISNASGNVAYYTAVAKVQVEDGVYPGMQATVTIPQESVENVVILKMDALSFDMQNNAFVYMQNDAGEMEKTQVEVGVDNGNYIEITSGLADGDVCYVVSDTTETSSALSALMSGTFGQQNINARSGFDRGNFDPSTMGGSNRNGANSGTGGGNMPAMPGN